ncbi:glycosyltransferase family 2 protein [Maritimibacter dapengensis]|uniref:Glycosyltransferase family 2 protein n=1 Tax=Maritimibacter dapengensis TaxID=2836868 RepID=A0ABS6T716_9RHOB|nr:glycosyltransferase family A protein [Maritimibacter dapengensis]MBV7380306.1 glycosyltransferase family 2 protein [Maritimibacter dapengensis]
MSRTLIICPTHDHADTIVASLNSVRKQNLGNWKLVVIGDGAPMRTRELVAAISQQDPRIAYVERDKGARLGEAHRDPVIRESEAEFVCHLGDDDLWAPDHLAQVTSLLRDADFGMAGSLYVEESGRVAWDFANHAYLRPPTPPWAPVPLLLGGINNVSYRRDAYLGLVEGWAPAPPEWRGSDIYMWHKFYADPRVRVASSASPSHLKFMGSGTRKTWTPAERVAEIAPWAERLDEPGFIAEQKQGAVFALNFTRALVQADAEFTTSLEDALSAAGFSMSSDTPDVALDGEVMGISLSHAQKLAAQTTVQLIQLFGVEDPSEQIARVHALDPPKRIVRRVFCQMAHKRPELAKDLGNRLASELGFRDLGHRAVILAAFERGEAEEARAMAREARRDLGARAWINAILAR